MSFNFFFNNFSGKFSRIFSKASMDLNFAANKSLVDNRTGQSIVTFARTGNATYVDIDGLIKTATTGVARFEHNPITRESLGLLIESQRSNVLRQSEDFTTTWATFGATVSSNSTTAPDGASTADKLVNSAVNEEHGIFQTTTTSGSQTFSIFAKQAELRYLVLRKDTPSVLAVFDLQTGTVTQTTGVTATIVAFPGGWYRCTITCTSTGNAVVKLSNVGTGVVASSGYLGVAGQGIFLWGAQMETGAYATSYIPTTTATVTRNADSATISTGFSNWFDAVEGTMFSSSLLARQNTDAGLMFFEVSNGTVNQALRCFSRSTGSSGFSVVASASTQADLNPNVVITANNPLKIAAAYAVNNFAASFNGGDALTDTAGSLPTGINQASIGVGTTGTILNGTIARVTYWPTRLSDSTLRRLSR